MVNSFRFAIASVASSAVLVAAATAPAYAATVSDTTPTVSGGAGNCTVGSPVTASFADFSIQGVTNDGSNEDYLAVYILDENDIILSSDGRAAPVGGDFDAFSTDISTQSNQYRLIVEDVAFGPAPPGNPYVVNANTLIDFSFTPADFNADCVPPDATAPRIASIERQTPSTSPTNADSLTWRVTFDEPVQNVTDFSFSVAGTTGTHSVANISSTQTDVTISGGDLADLDGTVTLSTNTGAVPSLNIVSTITDAGLLELDDVSRATSATVGGTVYLFTAAFADDGVSVFSVASDGTLTNVFNVTDSGSLELDGAADLTTAVVNGTTYLFVAGQVDDGVSVFSVADDGSLTNVDNVADDTTLRLNGAVGLTAHELDGTTHLFVSGNIDQGISVFSVANDGTLTNTFNIIDTVTLELSGVRHTTILEIGATTYLYSSGQGDDGISVFTIANDGTLTNVENIPDDGTLELDNVSMTEIVEIDGTIYLLASGNADDGISVFSINPADGTLTNVFNITDDGTLALDYANGLQTVEISNQVYVLATGRSDSGINVFTMAADGSLTLYETLLDNDDRALALVNPGTLTLINGAAFYFVPSGWEDGITSMSFVAPAPSDLAGNALSNTTPTGTNDNTFEVDNTAPAGYAVTLDQDPINAGGQDAVSFTFASAVVGAGYSYSFTTDGGAGSVDGSGTIATATDQISGIDLSGLADGTITLTVSLSDAAGNAGADATDTAAKDATAPAAPTLLDLVSGSDTGYDDTDNITNATSPTFTGTAEAGATVTLISSQDGVLGSATADGSGDWSITSSALSENVHTITATATDAVNNTSPASAGLSVTVDLTDPSVPSAPDLTAATDTGTSNTDNITNDATPVLEGTGEPNTGVSLVSSVAGDNLAAGTITSVGVDGSGNWSATLPALADGSRTIIAVGFDAAGNTSTFASGLTLTVDASAPGLTAFARNTPATEDTDADTLVFDITFDEAVLNVGAADFDITGTTGTGVLAGSGSAYTLTVSGGDLADLSSGDVGLDLNTGHGITDAAGNALPDGEPATDETYAVLNTVPPGFTKVFGPNSILAGGSSTLTFTIDNSANAVSATALDFTDTFPAGMTVASPANAATTCTGGTVTAVSGSGTVSYTGGAVLAGATCTVSVDVTSSTLGDALNTTGDLTSSLGNSGTASDTLTVNDGTAPRVSSIVRQSPTDQTTSADSVTWRVTFDEAVTAPASLSNRANFRDSGSVALRSTYDLEFVEIDGSTFLFSAALGDDGISTFLVDSDGSLTDVATTSDTPTVFLDGVYRLASAVVGGTPYLIASAYYEDGLSVFSIDNAGALTNVDNVADDATLNLRTVAALHTVVVDGTTYLYVGGEADDGLSVFSLDALGQLTNIQNISDAGALELDGVGGIASAVVDGTPYLFTAGRFDDGLSVFSIGNDGTLTNVANQDNSGGNLEGAENVSIAVIDATTFLFVTAQDSDAISAYAVGNDGSLTFADSIADTAELQLDRVNGMATISKDGTTYVLAIARTDDAISAFSVASDGTLTPVAAALQSDNPLFELNNLSALAVRDIDGSVIAISGDADGISAFELIAPGVGPADFVTENIDATLAVNAVSSSVYDVAASGTGVETGDSSLRLAFADDQSIEDIAGNALTNTEPTGANENEYFLDNSPPIVTDIFASNNATVGSTLVTWFVSINEDPDNLTIDDFTLDTTAGVTASDLQIAADNGTSVTVTANLTGSGTAQLKFDAETDIVDAIGNGNGTNGYAPAYDDASISVATVDTVPPTLSSITRFGGADEATNADALVWLVTFDTPVRNVDAADFELTGTSAGLTVAIFENSDQPVFAGLPAPAPVPLSQTYRVTASGGDLSDLDGSVSLALAAAPSINDANENALIDTDATGATESYDVRNTAPALASITRSSPAGSPTNADSLVWDLSFSAIDGSFTLPAGAFTVSGTTATVTNVERYSIGLYVTVSGGDLADLDGDVTLGLTDSDFTDDYGNVMDRTIPGGAELTFTIDNTAPRIAIISRNNPNTEDTNSDVLIWRVTFGEAVGNVDAGDFSVGGTTASVTAVNTVSAEDLPEPAGDLPPPLVTAFSYDVTVSGGDLAGLDGTVTLTPLTTGGITDAAGNLLASAVPTGANQNSYDLDNSAPTLTSILRQTPSGQATNADSLTWLATFSEAVAADAADFAVYGTTATISVQPVAGDQGEGSVPAPLPASPVWSVTVTGGDLADLDAAVSLVLADTPSIIDNVGNALTDTNATGATESYDVRNTAPAIGSIARLTPATSPTNADTLVWRVTFAEIDSTFDLPSSAFTVAGTTATVTDVSRFSTGFDVTVSGGDLGGLNGDVTLGLTDSDFTDDYGNVMDRTIPGGAELTFAVDNTAPDLSTTGPTGPVSGAFTATFTFSEDVTGFELDNISVGNGAASDLQTADNVVFTATITPSGDGDVTVDVAADAASDAAGNTSTAATQFSVENDETAPRIASITRQSPATEQTDADSLTWRVAFSEFVQGADAGDFQIAGTTATLSVSPAVVAPGAIGNDAPPHSTTNTFDVTASGGDLAELNGSVILSALTSGGITDNAGNAFANASPTGTNDNTYSVINDAEAPTVLSIVRRLPFGELTNADSLTWQVTFSEAVDHVDASDFAASGTTAAVTSVSPVAAMLPPSVSGADRTGGAVPFAVSTQAFEVTVSGGDLADLDGAVTLGFAAGQDIADEAGNDLTDTAPTGVNQGFTLDNTAPTVVIGSDASAPVTGAFEITVTFSEDVTGFDVSDLTVGNGTASNFVTVSAQEYSATITPGTGSTVTVDVAQDAASDGAGNGNEAATSFTITYDNQRTLTVSFSGLGSGQLTSLPEGLDCREACETDFTVGTAVIVRVTADEGSEFQKWTSGPCAGTRNGACIIPMDNDQEIGVLFRLSEPEPSYIVAATLPGARSGYVGGPQMSSFLTVIGRSETPAQNCYVSAPSNAPVTLSSREIDGTGAAFGPTNPYFDLAQGETISLVLGMTPTDPTDEDGYVFRPLVNCDNARLDHVEGLNTVLLHVGAAPLPDILSVSATPSGDGVIRIAESGRAQLMTASALNIGAGDGSAGNGEVTLTVTADTGEAVLPLTLELCQLNSSAVCITPRGENATVLMEANEPLFFAVFARDASGGAGIPFDPANARVFLRFADATGAIRSVTSAAVTAPPAADQPEALAGLPVGRWSVLMREATGAEPGLVRASIYVLPDGRAVIDDGNMPRTVALSQTGERMFVTGQQDGMWTLDGRIRLGEAWSATVGEYWGVRDARTDRVTRWADLAGEYGALTVRADGTIAGVLDGCIVSGQGLDPEPSMPGHLTASLNVMSCATSGTYRAVIDLPANDNDAPRLVIAGDRNGWALSATQ